MSYQKIWLLLVLLVIGCQQTIDTPTTVAILPTDTQTIRATPTDLPIVATPTEVLASATPVTRATPTLPPTVTAELTPTEMPAVVPSATVEEIVEEMPAFPLNYTYEIINSYPHDPAAFTQGLIYEDGIFYEGTGLWGQSTVRKVVPETGDVLQQISIGDEYFGEGITIFGDRIIQLTWQSNTGFVYDKNSFELLQTFNYPTEGWGIAHDGDKLIMSDGTPIIYFWDAETLAEIGQITVMDGDVPVTRLNELEYIDGEIWANVWQTNQIARIDPATGQVVGWVDLTGLLADEFRTQPVDVLNGIAYDAENDRLFVTGKLWPRLFEIKVVPE